MKREEGYYWVRLWSKDNDSEWEIALWVQSEEYKHSSGYWKACGVECYLPEREVVEIDERKIEMDLSREDTDFEKRMMEVDEEIKEQLAFWLKEAADDIIYKRLK